MSEEKYPNWAAFRPAIWSGRIWPDTGPDQVGQPEVGMAVVGARGGFKGHVHYPPAIAREIAHALLEAADAAEACGPGTRCDDRSHRVGHSKG